MMGRVFQGRIKYHQYNLENQNTNEVDEENEKMAAVDNEKALSIQRVTEKIKISHERGQNIG